MDECLYSYKSQAAATKHLAFAHGLIGKVFKIFLSFLYSYFKIQEKKPADYSHAKSAVNHLKVVTTCESTRHKLTTI